MPLMVVTLEVFQLDTSALKFRKLLKRPLMSVTAETSQSAMRPYVAMAAVGLALYAWTAVFRESLVVKVVVKTRRRAPPARAFSEGEGNGGGGIGSDGGDGDGGGGGAQPRCLLAQHHVDWSADHGSFVVQSKRGGGDDGDGGWNCTTKDPVPCLAPLAKEKLCPKPGASHFAPFQPSPYESVMLRVHVAPSSTANGKLEVNGAPPPSVVPSEQLRLQPTSFGYNPLEQVIAEEIVGATVIGRAARSIGNNCGGTAPERTRWRVVESELGFNESSLAPSSGPMSMSLSARTPSAVFACMFTRVRHVRQVAWAVERE